MEKSKVEFILVGGKSTGKVIDFYYYYPSIFENVFNANQDGLFLEEFIKTDLKDFFGRQIYALAI